MIIRYLAFVSILLIVVHHSVFGQRSPLQDIRTAYESFEYGTVIRLAEKLLEHRDSLTTAELIEVSLLKATSHFSLGEEDASRQTIIGILVLQSDYRPDSERFSPKITQFFDKVRADYLQMVEQKKQISPPPKDTSSTNKLTPRHDGINRGAILRSFVLPGWGHGYISDSPKSWILLSASAATLGSMTYFIVTTVSRERDYLNETTPDLIEEKYDRYNASYKLRNAFVVTYAVLWLYAQVDLLLLSDRSAYGQTVNFAPAVFSNHTYGVTVSFPLDPSR